MSTTFSQSDLKFLRIMGVRFPHDTPVHIAKQNDNTVRQLQKMKLPVTRENYLMLAFAGSPPAGSLTQSLPKGLEDYLPEELQIKGDRQ